jgi:hypothetical protein
MILNAENGKGAVFHTFHGIVIQVDVSDLDFIQVESVGIDGETVILRCNLNLLPLNIQHRMISAMMAEL